jgi:hypothetical protein
VRRCSENVWEIFGVGGAGNFWKKKLRIWEFWKESLERKFGSLEILKKLRVCEFWGFGKKLWILKEIVDFERNWGFLKEIEDFWKKNWGVLKKIEDFCVDDWSLWSFVTILFLTMLIQIMII